MFRADIESDFKAILNGEFAEEITISNGANSVTIRGIFDKTFQMVDPDSQAVMISSKPRVTIWKSDVPFTVKQGHSVTARSRTYKIREPQDEGEGAVTLYLE